MLGFLVAAGCVSGAVIDTSAGDSDVECETGGLGPQPSDDFLAAYPPVVVRTVPEAGDQAVDPALTEIRVTFSRDMADGSWSWVQIGANVFPETTGDPHYEGDRTNVLPVALEPDHNYVLWINSDPYLSFQDSNGNSAVPYQLAFRTSGD